MMYLYPLFFSFRRLEKIIYVLILIIFSFSSCSKARRSYTYLQKYEITEEEKKHLKEFFRDVLFDNPGAYTLYGTKPMSISSLYYLTQEERQKSYEDYLLLPNEEKAKYILERYDLSANYTHWEKIKTRLPVTQYLFGTFSSPYAKRGKLLLFVNIELTLKMLLNHYEDFRHLLGTDFDPFEVVFELENSDSWFWNKVISSHTLLGILLGFGKSNAWFFEWNRKYGEKQNKKGAFLQSLPWTTNWEEYIVDYNPKDFSLPIFGCYGLHTGDAIMKNYEKERNDIKALYKGRDEVDLVLEWLTR